METFVCTYACFIKKENIQTYMKAEKIVKNVQLLGTYLPSSKYSILTFLILPMHLRFSLL